MTTFSDLTNDLFLLMEGYGLEQGRSAFTTTNLADTDFNFAVDSAADVSEGLAEIEDELIYIRSIDDTSKNVTIAPDGRGYRGTAPAPHASSSRLTMNPVLPRAVAKRKINETIVGVYPTLFGKATTTLTVDPVSVGYEMPADVDRVLSITYEETGPAKLWVPVRRWNLDSNADTDRFPSGKALNLLDGPLTSTVVRVVYLRRPVELVNPSDDLTSTGLQSSARAVIVAGAAWRLVSFMDMSRLKVNTAIMEEVAAKNPIGTATQVSSFLRKQYERELADEQARQQLATPPIIHWAE